MHPEWLYLGDYTNEEKSFTHEKGLQPKGVLKRNGVKEDDHNVWEFLGYIPASIINPFTEVWEDLDEGYYNFVHYKYKKRMYSQDPEFNTSLGHMLKQQLKGNVK